MRKNLSKQEFNRLTVGDPVGRDKHRKVLWECTCICGNKLVVQGASLKSGNTQSCGCHHHDIVTTHGQSASAGNTRTYRLWAGIRQRCLNPANPDWDNYGGRGITVCEQWASFECFLEDMGECPSTAHSIDRWPDLNGNYGPGNTRWATRSEQCRNTRGNHNVTIGDETHCVTAWAEIYDIPARTVFSRLHLGWDAVTALTTPVKHRRRPILQ